MREILFRGKRADNGEWVEGGFFTREEKCYIVVRERYMPDTRDCDTADYYEKHTFYKIEIIEVIPETVGQYTGLTDKNGKKIVEGDVIKYNIKGSKVHDIGKVVYWKGAFCLERHIWNWNETLRHRIGEIGSESDMGASFSYEYEYKIIGNIHDNPELLKGGAE